MSKPNGITLITPTGDRIKSLARCRFYVDRFEKPDVPIQWIVVDDGIQQAARINPPSNVDLHYFNVDNRRIKKEAGYKHTLGLNLWFAVDHVMYENVMFIEDDDWYSPLYMKRMYEALNTSEMAGESYACYYNVPKRLYRLMGNTVHASLCQTAIRSHLLQNLRIIIQNSPDHNFLDYSLWKTPCSKVLTMSRNCVGIKGLIGREGIGVGHQASKEDPNWQSDPRGETLQNWIGVRDAAFYGV